MASSLFTHSLFSLSLLSFDSCPLPAPSCAGAVVKQRAQQFYTVIITYLVCTLTDSALRLLLVMQMNASGFTAMGVAVTMAFNELFALFTSILITFLQYHTNAKKALLFGMFCQVSGVRVDRSRAQGIWHTGYGQEAG